MTTTRMMRTAAAIIATPMSMSMSMSMSTSDDNSNK